ncbi:hypothetical protein Purlil1_10042 [Purpureocillium lilacinum]|uniref:Swim zinc finger domain protein n=2 Tax=Purpureocillium lilacinum TaxID=33203 RepID=A0ABR0BNW3_PURLI|nr:hypothetical protein Purlil1_10042 [Purpureocillium lilacinum]
MEQTWAGRLSGSGWRVVYWEDGSRGERREKWLQWQRAKTWRKDGSATTGSNSGSDSSNNNNNNNNKKNTGREGQTRGVTEPEQPPITAHHVPAARDRPLRSLFTLQLQYCTVLYCTWGVSDTRRRHVLPPRAWWAGGRVNPTSPALFRRLCGALLPCPALPLPSPVPSCMGGHQAKAAKKVSCCSPWAFAVRVDWEPGSFRLSPYMARAARGGGFARPAALGWAHARARATDGRAGAAPWTILSLFRCCCLAGLCWTADARRRVGTGYMTATEEPTLRRRVAEERSLLKAMVRHYNFGVEIEAIGRPYGGGGDTFSNVDWYRQLAQKLQNRGIPAAHDDCSKYSKHPEYYGGKWFVTRDGSLKRPRPYVCMEVVSPRLDTKQAVSRTLSDFWEAMRVHFVPQRDASCGGHVHVTPVSLRNRFSLRSLKRVAFAALAYEDFVAAVLPAARRDNQFCRLNSLSPEAGVRRPGGALALAGGVKSVAVLRRVADEIRALPAEADLYLYMQGNRYVLWNFQNIFPSPKTGRCTGTVEFRGGNQFLNTRGTLAWVAFVLGFITLALKEDLLDNFSTYVSPAEPNFPHRLAEWWVRLRRAAKKSRMSRHLPDDWTKMKSR